ncbi:hypothetical protein OLX02_02525 [Novosphingobium sp. KCTC 2891]|uniref:hypothetical protein n=1 Tax=Novosphingobium sp. KCTC 2891 TaxID=2989730 RepID=UPI00222184F0|nr:hypothetical protein [Novosphingobium sp. KCTC 2891]MCW1381691.1 hypothetical protein [Novosphingobium sp. KCTC 2891]
MKKVVLAALAACTLPCAAHAAPGMGDEVYGATTEKGEVELEARYGALAGGADDGEDALKLEAAYSPTDRLRLGAQLELEREPSGPRKAEAASFEAIYTLGRVAGIDVALYGEYEVGLLRDTPDAVEGKILLQRKAGPLDARLNLIFQKHLATGQKVEVGYAASADYAVAGDELRVGVAAFGDLGSFHRFLPSAEHFVGPIVKTEIEGLGPEIGIEAGYLFAVDKARDDTKGQFRLMVEMEF